MKGRRLKCKDNYASNVKTTMPHGVSATWFPYQKYGLI